MILPEGVMADDPNPRDTARLLVRYSSFSSLTFLITFGIDVSTQIALGHLSATHLAAGSLGLLVCNVTGVFMILGLLSAQDTLSSQAFGAKDFKALGEVLQRSVVIVLVFMVPVAVMWLHGERLLLLFQQPPDVARLAGMYSSVMVAGLFPRVCSEALKRFLQAQGIFSPQVACSGIVLAVHPFVLRFLIYKQSLGLLGGVLANVFAAWLNLAVLAVVVVVWRPHHPSTWGGWSLAALRRGWAEFLHLGVPGTVMMCVEWWSFEALSLRAGSFGTTQLAAMNILNTIATVAFMLSMGLSTAAQTALGNSLGANKPRSAMMVVVVGLVMGALLSGGVCTVLYSVRHVVAQVFTNDAAVVSLVTATTSWVCLFELLDTTQAVGQGLLRGAGKQKLGALVLLVCCYGITLPGAWSLSKSRGVRGLWMGMNFGYAFVLLGILLALGLTDWVDLAQKAHERQRLDAVDEQAWRALRQSEGAVFGIGSDDEDDDEDDDDDDDDGHNLALGAEELDADERTPMRPNAV